MELSIRNDLKNVVGDRLPLVALESTVIATGLPAPYNLQAAWQCEEVIKSQAAEPATVAIIDGVAKIGCSQEEIVALASRDDVIKTNLSNLGAVVARKQWGATTVSTTMHIASRAGIEVFSTGGIGGVHRGAEQSFDLSSDLMALARYPMVVVSAGAKSILDLPKTVELLETLGVPVIGYCTDQFPAFHSRSSGIGLDLVSESANEIAAIATTHWLAGFSTAILVVAAVPQEYEIAAEEIEQMYRKAEIEAKEQGITGKKVTPYLLSKLETFSSSRTVLTNVELLKNNARVAAEIAVELAKRKR
ncbi:MAG: pseudouridine-5'-phosphate glycosidase [Blastocatellia bacterium]|nr:pseudouridine-5'-phosphate glycosidase [Blastocatellia bacterium]